MNPYACGDGGCVLNVPGKPVGMHTNGGCRCLPNHLDPETRTRVRNGIRWLAERAAKMEALVDEGFTIVNDHLPYSHEYWLDRVMAETEGNNVE